MQNGKNRDCLALENVEHSKWKSRNQHPVIVLVVNRPRFRLTLDQRDRSVGATQKVSPQPDGAPLIPLTYLSHVALGYRTDDKTNAHKERIRRSLTSDQGEPSDGFFL